MTRESKLCQVAFLNLYLCSSSIENGGDGSRDHRCHVHLQLWRFHSFSHGQIGQKQHWTSYRHTRVSRNLWKSCAICIDAKSVITTWRENLANTCFTAAHHVWLPSSSVLVNIQICQMYILKNNLICTYFAALAWFKIVLGQRWRHVTSVIAGCNIYSTGNCDSPHCPRHMVLWDSSSILVITCHINVTLMSHIQSPLTSINIH